MPQRTRDPVPAAGRPALYEELFDLFFELFAPLRGHFAASAAAVGVSPAQAKTLRLLHAPRPMRELAVALSCDASYVTGLIDQLETQGLVERQPDPGDRRVKQVRLTRQGRAARTRFEALLF